LHASLAGGEMTDWALTFLAVWFLGRAQARRSHPPRARRLAQAHSLPELHRPRPARAGGLSRPTAGASPRTRVRASSLSLFPVASPAQVLPDSGLRPTRALPG